MFIRSKRNPVLRPNPNNWWEAKKLYNPGAIFYNKKYHLFYRAVGSGENWKSSIGYAVSHDGENFIRFNEPFLIGENEKEKRGLEDPRITKIDNIFYMLYAAYDGITPRLNIATSTDLKNWQKHGPVFSDWKFKKANGVYIKFKNGKPTIEQKTSEWSKSGGMFSEKINGKYLMLFGEYNIWFADSDDGFNWTGDLKPFLKCRPGNYFDNTFVEMGPPPIKTDKGWLVLYHGINNHHYYKIGFLLLDLKNPRKILFRTENPIFEPLLDYELSGMVDILPGGLSVMQKMSDKKLTKYLAKAEAEGIMPKVTFCCGAVIVNGILRIYYGAADSVICTATVKLDELLNYD